MWSARYHVPDETRRFILSTADERMNSRRRAGVLVGARGEPGERATAYRLRDSIAGTPIVPIGLVKFDAGAPRVALFDLRSRGVTVPRVVGGEHVMTGGFDPVDAKGKLASTEHRDEFSMRDKAFGIS
jgi:hypothetical protein